MIWARSSDVRAEPRARYDPCFLLEATRSGSALSSRSSKTDASPTLPRWVTVGRVRRPHGVRGALLVTVLTDVPDRFAVGEPLSLVSSGGDRRTTIIAQSRRIASGQIVQLREIGSRDEAETLRGWFLEVERERVPPAPEGSYYHFELIGCRCVDLEAGELGWVTGVVDDGGGLLLEIEGPRQSLLVPFVKAYLRDIDTQARRLVFQLPEGLIETCGSRS